MTIEERIKNHVCVFCEGKLEKFGNNPDPACTIPDAECCDYCDETIVWPARGFIDQLIKKAVTEKNATDNDLEEDPEEDKGLERTVENDLKAGDKSDIFASEVDGILKRMQELTPETRRGCVDLLDRACNLMNGSKDPEADDQELTVAEADRFRKQFRRLEPDCRDTILKGLFSVDMEGRELKFESSELRKKSLLELYCALSEVHQEQAWQYVMLLLENQ